MRVLKTRPFPIKCILVISMVHNLICSFSPEVIVPPNPVLIIPSPRKDSGRVVSLLAARGLRGVGQKKPGYQCVICDTEDYQRKIKFFKIHFPTP
jgi:hypothetical protein